MISICLPVYNFNVEQLVKELHRQASNLAINFELIIADDASKPEFQAQYNSLEQLNNVLIFRLDHNVGRSRIRNFLAAKATCNFLLFMDCDSEIPSEFYLKNYLVALDSNTVLYGGRTYHAAEPTNKNFMLRWLYGSKREVVAANTRNVKPYLYFMTNNFVIPKQFFEFIQLNETIVGYGHEDTQLAEELKLANKPILHLDNPLIHIGLESADEFLFKTKQGVKNLALLMQQKHFNHEIKLSNFYLKISRIKGSWLLRVLGPPVLPLLQKQLKSSAPSLLLFDIYKLLLLAHFMHSNVQTR